MERARGTLPGVADSAIPQDSLIISSTSDLERPPNELWDYIFRSDSLDTEDLKRISLTCQRFRPIAQSILCENLVLPILSPYNADYKKAILYLKKPHITGRIKRLAYGRIGVLDTTTRRIIRSFHPPGRSHKFYGEAGLKMGKWQPGTAPFLHAPPEIHDFIATASQLCNLHTLCFAYVTLDMTDLVALLNLRNLVHLRLENSNVDDAKEAFPRDASEKYRFHLETLVITECNLCRLSIVAFEALLSSSTIRDLTVATTRKDLNNLIPSLKFPSLLRIQTISAPLAERRQWRWSSYFPKLKEVVFLTETQEDMNPIDAWDSYQTDQPHPPTKNCFSVQSFIGPLSEASSFFSPSLRRLRITSKPQFSNTWQLQQIQERCPNLNVLDFRVHGLFTVGPEGVMAMFHDLRELHLTCDRYTCGEVRMVRFISFVSLYPALQLTPSLLFWSI